MYPSLLKQNRMFRLSEGTGLSMEKINLHVFQFVDGTRNLLRQGQCLMQREVGDEEHICRKHRECKTSV